MNQESKEYVKKLKSLLSNINKKIVLLSENEYENKLDKSYNQKVYAGSYDIVWSLKQARELLDKKLYQNAFDLVCNIPAHIVVPHKGVSIEKLKKQSGGYVYIGSDKVYSSLDTARHYCRMISIDRSMIVDTTHVNNNMLILK